MLEFLLFLSPFALSFLIFYSVFTWDYISMGINLLFLSVFYIITAFFADRLRLGLLVQIPFTWTMFLYFVYVEYIAQLKSFYLIWRKEEVEWQRWMRKGVNIND
jgi:hypothetical protein